MKVYILHMEGFSVAVRGSDTHWWRGVSPVQLSTVTLLLLTLSHRVKILVAPGRSFLCPPIRAVYPLLTLLMLLETVLPT